MNENMSMASAAVSSAREGELAYFKYLSPNDTVVTGAHQAGYLIGKGAWKLLFPNLPLNTDNAERTVKIRWNNGDITTDSRFRFYSSKG